MLKKFTLLLAVFILVTGCSVHNKQQPSRKMKISSKQMPPNDFIPKNLDIVSVGDSLTQGIGDSTKRGGYIPYLKENIENFKGIGMVTFHNYGVKGDRTDQLQLRLIKPEIKNEIKKADIVMITIGGNDVMKVFRENFTSLKVGTFRVAINGYRERLNEIIKTIREYNPDVGIVLIGIYNPFGKWFSNIKEIDEIVLNWNKASAQTLSQYQNTQFVPIQDIFENYDKNLIYSDDFHPNDKGYMLMANRISYYLKKRKLIQLNE